METLKHIAIIPDGNRRWAKAHRLNPWEGHVEGVKRFWDISFASASTSVKWLTFWAASYDNLTKRSKLEVKFLTRLLSDELSKPEVRENLIKNQTRLRVIGEWGSIVNDKKLISTIESLMQETANFSKNNLTIMFAYDGQREMLSAVNTLTKNSVKQVDAQKLRNALWSTELPEVDLVIRTGGEPHWSAGFLMWQTANSQLYFTEKLWPDFKEQEFKKAIAEYDRRERRLGK